ncbi:hypothetical protein Pla100_12670 [Neorhodopirellula pilleata]|uniref:Uncharacterized protein n=1 Tax=Neorhodopirellula pilleata TaxID=2714738 RepID=A0A5C6ARB2_9BACT|nr:hypothetical protein Pla100_12670 [Neorhodopirellula pilleata]
MTLPALSLGNRLFWQLVEVSLLAAPVRAYRIVGATMFRIGFKYVCHTDSFPGRGLGGFL